MGAMEFQITSLNRLFRCRSKKTSKLRVTGLCVGNSPMTGEFPAQRYRNAENASIWWRHYALQSRPIVMFNLRIARESLPKWCFIFHYSLFGYTSICFVQRFHIVYHRNVMMCDQNVAKFGRMYCITKAISPVAKSALRLKRNGRWTVHAFILGDVAIWISWANKYNCAQLQT